jgi:hypothetical protein
MLLTRFRIRTLMIGVLAFGILLALAVQTERSLRLSRFRDLAEVYGYRERLMLLRAAYRDRITKQYQRGEGPLLPGESALAAITSCQAIASDAHTEAIRLGKLKENYQRAASKPWFRLD